MGGNVDLGTNDITNATSITATNLTGTLQTAAQANVTSVGTLSSLVVTGDMTVDTSTLHVDSTNNYIGVGTAVPAVSLDIQTTDAIQVPVGTDGQRPTGADGMIRYNSTSSEFEGYSAAAWAAIGSGGGGSWTESGTDIYYNDGDVGIGHSNDPVELLDVRDAATASAGVGARLGEAFVGAWGASNSYAVFAHKDNNSTTDYCLIHNSSGTTLLNASTGQGIAFRINNTDKMNITSAGLVGIGENAPSADLHIKQTGESYSTTGGIRLERKDATTFWQFFVNGNEDLEFGYNGGGSYGGYLKDDTNVANIDFTGQHRSQFRENNEQILKNISDYVGLIVISTGTFCSKVGVDEALPFVELSNTDSDKRVFGIVSDAEDMNSTCREYSQGAFVSKTTKNEGDDRAIINSLGEGAMWICNKSGDGENGDYISSSSVTGYGMKQKDDLLHNYTVAKLTQDEDFSDMTNVDFSRWLTENGSIISEDEYNILLSSGRDAYKAKFVGCTYHCG